MNLLATNPLAKYSLAGIPREPATATLGITALSGALSIGGSLFQASAQNAAGQAQQQAGEITARNSLAAAQFASDTALRGADMISRNTLAGAELTARAAERGGALEAEGAQRQAAVIADFAEGRADLVAAVKRQGGAMAADALRRGGELSEQAGELSAVASRTAEERRREIKLTLSALQARAAASGGDASDETIKRLAGDIATRGEYNVLSELFIGESRARGLEDTAAQHRFAGRSARYGADLQADATLFTAEAEALAAEYEGAATAVSARTQGETAAEIAAFRAAAQAATARFQGRASSEAALFQGQSSSTAALMEGQHRAEAARFAGAAAASSASTMALGTILGGAGSVARSFIPMMPNFNFTSPAASPAFG